MHFNEDVKSQSRRRLQVADPDPSGSPDQQHGIGTSRPGLNNW